MSKTSPQASAEDASRFFSEIARSLGILFEQGSAFESAVLARALPHAVLELTEAALSAEQKEELKGLRERGANLGRQIEWAEGRRAVAQIRERFEKLGISPDHIKTSITHSQGFLIGAGVGHPSLVPPRFGIDMERKDRLVRPDLKFRILGFEGEERLALGALEAWVIKEACFKSADPKRGIKVIGEIEILEFKAGAACLAKTANGHCFSYVLLQSEEWLFALARET
jgi:hypothetical protein